MIKGAKHRYRIAKKDFIKIDIRIKQKCIKIYKIKILN